MKLDELSRDELISLLAQKLAQCKESFSNTGCVFKEGEYYEVFQDSFYVTFTDDSGNELDLDYTMAKTYFKTLP